MNITAPSVANKRSFSREMQKLRTNQQILTILILLFICMTFWIIVSIFSSQNSTQVTAEATRLARPLTPTLDETVLDTIEAKQTFTDEELADFPIYIIVEDSNTRTRQVVEIGSGEVQRSTAPTPAPTPIPTATPVATPTSTPTDSVSTDTPTP